MTDFWLGLNALGMIIVAIFAFVQWELQKKGNIFEEKKRKDSLYKMRLDCYERVFTFWVASSFELGLVFAGEYIGKTTDEIFKKYDNQKNFLLLQVDLLFPADTWQILKDMQTNMETNSPLLANKNNMPKNLYDVVTLHNHFRNIIKLDD